MTGAVFEVNSQSPIPPLPTRDRVARPIAGGRRLVALDVLRGFALLGILAVNIEDFGGPESLHDIPLGMAKAAFTGWHAHLDVAILAWKWLFVEGKMRGLFAMLFGASAILLTDQIDARGHPGASADIFLRRNMWLALFGLIHGLLIWHGDVLLTYGLCALIFLYPLRHVRARWLVVAGLALSLVGGTLGIVRFIDAPTILHADALQVAGRAAERAGQTPTSEQQDAIAAAEKDLQEAPAKIAEAVKQGRENYLQAIPRNAASFISFVSALFGSGWVLEVVGSMLLGMGLYKTGFLIGRLSVRTYVITAIIGYAIAAPIVIKGVASATASGFDIATSYRWLYIPYYCHQIPAMLANASIVLLFIKAGWAKPLVRALGAVGRTAFSNYIATSLICRFVFAWGPWKLYGSLEYYQYCYVVILVWFINLIVSPLWLRAFAYGPLEWLWRSLTYWQRQPFRRIVANIA